LGCCSLSSFLLANSATAQEITPDGTTDTQITDDSNGNFTIERGDRAGDNLFHSFDRFSVPTDGSALFDNATDISNIFSRVTGGNLSNIDGLIEANGTANLFLINPAGIMFGSNARLDIGGSFLGTTADSILFEDGTFSAVDLDNPPLLTVNAPIGLNFRDDPAPIDNQSTASANFDSEQVSDDNFFGLRVPDGKTLALAGGDITVDGGGIVAVSGRIELGAVSTSGRLGITFAGDDISFSFADDLAKANVSLINNAGLFGGILGNLDSSVDLETVTGNGGDIIINTGQLNILDGSLISTSSINTGNGGNINLGSEQFPLEELNLTNGASISVSTFGLGNAGNVSIFSDNVNIDGGADGLLTGFSGLVGVGATGNGGNINLGSEQSSIQQLTLESGGQIVANTFGEGDAGNLFIFSNNINIDGGTNGFITGLFAQVGANAIGNGGNINLGSEQSSIQQLTLRSGGQTLADTFGEGDAGNLFIFSKNINLDGQGFLTGFSTSVRENATGKGGNINLGSEQSPVEQFVISNSAGISISTFGRGDAGNLSVLANNIDIDGGTNGLLTGFLGSVEENAIGRGGNINLGSEQLPLEQLTLRNGAQIVANTFSEGDAGNLSIFSNDIELDGGSNGFITGLFAQVGANATGQGGNINIGSEQFSTEQLNILNRGIISPSTFAQGDAGSLSIFSNNINIDGGSNSFLTGFFASVEENATGQGGNINLGSEQSPLQQLTLRSGAQIVANTFSEGDAGNLSIFSNDIELDGQGFLTGFFASIGSGAIGRGGNVSINTDSLALIDGGRVAANVEPMGEGNAGTLEITANDSIVVRGIDLNGAPSAITSVVNGGGENGEGIGNGGEVIISTGSLSLLDGGRVSATSLGQGNGGDLTINASESISISGTGEIFRSGISVDALINDGNSGNANVTTDRLTIENGGTIEASNIDSFGQFPSGTGEPGNITVEANSIALNNGGRIDSATQSETGEGANINLQVADLITLQNDSFISAQAFNAANGGNLTIDTGFIVAFPGNNDIIANAQQGEGGVININAESILGISERPLSDRTNDINASSEDSTLDGNIVINTSDINPIRGTTELPSNPVEVDRSVVQACGSNQQGETNSLVVQGRGGIPATPTEPLSSESIATDIESISNRGIITAKGKIIPAMGVTKTKDGRILLTATSSNSHERSTGFRNCNGT